MVLRERTPDGLYDCYIEMAGERLIKIPGLYRKYSSFAGNDRRLAQEVRDRSTV